MSTIRTGLLTIFAISLLSPMLAQNTSYQPDPKWQAPPHAAARINPLAAKPDAAAGGKKLSLRNSAECHAESGGGKVKKHAGGLQLSVEQPQSHGRLVWKITNGTTERVMPSVSP